MSLKAVSAGTRKKIFTLLRQCAELGTLVGHIGADVSVRKYDLACGQSLLDGRCGLKTVQCIKKRGCIGAYFRSWSIIAVEVALHEITRGFVVTRKIKNGYIVTNCSQALSQQFKLGRFAGA